MLELIHPHWDLPLKKGTLSLTACPGTQGLSLEKSLKQLQDSGVTALITLLSDQELEAAGLENFIQTVKKVGLDSFHVPAPDDDLPGDVFEKRWQAALHKIEEHLSANHSVAIHCMGGSGRTGLIAGRLMLNQGFSSEDIISKIRALRPKSFSLDAQKNYIKGFALGNSNEF